MTNEKKPFYKSKTKIAAILIGISPILAISGGMLNGSISLADGLATLATQIGIVLGIFGIRDWNIINGNKE